MSMINQMLKDLDKRQAVAGEGQALSGVLSSSSRKSYPRPGFIILLLVSIVIVAPLVWSRWHKSRPAPPVAVTVVSANAPSAAPLATTQPAPSTPAAVPPAPTFSPSAKASVPLAKSMASQPDQPATVVSKAESSAEPKAKQKAEPERDTHASKPASSNASSNASFNASFKVVSPKQRSENLYRQAISSIQQGHGPEAQNALRQALAINAANHDARLLLASLLADANHHADAAASLLHAGLAIAPGHSGFSMALARLQLSTGAKDEALATLEQGLPMAGDDPDYHAFLAALLQKQGRHEAATQHYITALRSNPLMPNWLIGAGISLRAINKPADAAEAFQRALDTGELAPEVAQFAQQQLKQIRQQ
jgi:Thioredoxin domain-containing protein